MCVDIYGYIYIYICMHATNASSEHGLFALVASTDWFVLIHHYFRA
jgi:hypothetical protein